jgi:hypothetical protein
MNTTEPKTWECCVCYNAGDKIPEGQPATVTGRVQTVCKHDICGTCYTRIIMDKGKDSLCPICRGHYWVKETQEPAPVLNPQNPALIDVLRILQIEPPRVYTMLNTRNLLFEF